MEISLKFNKLLRLRANDWLYAALIAAGGRLLPAIQKQITTLIQGFKCCCRIVWHGKSPVLFFFAAI